MSRLACALLSTGLGCIDTCNIHFHRLFLDGVYVERSDGTLHLHWVKAPTSAELTPANPDLTLRIGRHLEHQGLLEGDAESCYLSIPD